MSAYSLPHRFEREGINSSLDLRVSIGTNQLVTQKLTSGVRDFLKVDDPVKNKAKSHSQEGSIATVQHKKPKKADALFAQTDVSRQLGGH